MPSKGTGRGRGSKKPPSKSSAPSKGTSSDSKSTSAVKAPAPAPPARPPAPPIPEEYTKPKSTYSSIKYPASKPTTPLQTSASGRGRELEKSMPTDNPTYRTPTTSPTGIARITSGPLFAEPEEMPGSTTESRSGSDSNASSSGTGVEPRPKLKGRFPKSGLSDILSGAPPKTEKYVLDPTTARGRAAAGEPPLPTETPLKQHAGGSKKSIPSTTSRGTQASWIPASPSSPSKPTIGVSIPHGGKTITANWAEQIAEELKDAREMLKNAYVSALFFLELEEKAAVKLWLPQPDTELNYNNPKFFTQEVATCLYRRRHVQDYDDFVANRMGNPQLWTAPDYQRPRESYMEASQTITRLASDDADDNRQEKGKVRYEDWYLLKEFIPFQIAKLERERDQTEFDVLLKGGLTEQQARKQIHDFRVWEGVPPEKAKARVTRLASTAVRNAMWRANFP